MDLYKYNTSLFQSDEISFSESVDYFITSDLSNPLTNVDITYVYEDGVLTVEGADVELYYYTSVDFVCNVASIEGIDGQLYLERLNLFDRLNHEIDKIFFDTVDTTILELNGTFINTTITTKHLTYGMSITCILFLFIGFISFFKWLFRVVGGR